MKTRVADLEAAAWPLAGDAFRCDRRRELSAPPALASAARILADDGTLLYETFAAGNEAYGKPSNPDFLLAPSELLARAHAG